MASAIETLLKKYQDYAQLASEVREKPLLSFGPLSLNLLLGSPDGIPSGRIVQITGKPSHGKTTLALDIVRQFLLRHPDELALYVDFERTLDSVYAEACGVPLNRMVAIRADYAEQGIEIVEEFVNNGVRLVVIDSVPAALPKDELDKDFTDRPKMASSAAIITRMCQRNIGLIDNKNATLVLINQMRKNFSTMSREEEIPFGGMALQYASSVIVHVQKVETKEDTISVRATVKKSKVARPAGKADFVVRYGKGIDHALDVLRLGVEYDVVDKSGAWFKYTDDNGMLHRGQGEENAAKTLPMHEIAQKVVARYYSMNDQPFQSSFEDKE